MRFDRELLKGSIATLLLTLLVEEPMYGYQIAQKVNTRTAGEFTLKEGTLYAALHKLEREGFLKAQWQTHPNGRRRKYYHITSKGSQIAVEKQQQWYAWVKVMNAAMEGSHG